jgi:GT2 family glycosyltransferase
VGPLVADHETAMMTADDPKVRFPPVERPDASIIVVTHNSAADVGRCLRALHGSTSVSFEVLVADNASRDGTVDCIDGAAEGATIVANQRNLGFATACNQLALQARGSVLCFLNPDVVVEPGWLEALCRALDDEAVGAAAPAILHPDGRLQEAGSVIFADGSCRAVGDGEDADAPGHRFARDVYYASGACLALRRSTFVRCGGFDTRYDPAYYEDVALGLALVRAGHVVRYEPRGRVRHRRGASHSPAAAALLLESRRRFRTLERTALLDRPPVPAAPGVPDGLRNEAVRPRLLLIDDRVPNVDRGSGDPRMAALLESLRAAHPRALITLVARDPVNAPTYAAPLLDRDIEVVWGPEDWPRWFEERRGLYDVVVVSRPTSFDWAHAMLDETQPQARRVYDAESLYFRRLARMAEAVPLARRPALRAEADHWRRVEVTAMAWADVVVAVSEDAARTAEMIAPDTPAVVLSHVVPVPASVRGFAERGDVVFFGGFAAGPGGPNEDAAVIAARDVFPRIRRASPVELHIMGADPTAAVLALDGGGVRVVGPVDDQIKALQRYRVHLSPLRYGAGLKLRFLDTMAAGLPFVTTTVGAEDLGLDDELRTMLVADRPAGLAEQTVRLLNDAPRWAEASGRLRHLAAERYARPSFDRAVDDLLVEVGLPCRRPAMV